MANTQKADSFKRVRGESMEERIVRFLSGRGEQLQGEIHKNVGYSVINIGQLREILDNLVEKKILSVRQDKRKGGRGGAVNLYKIVNEKAAKAAVSRGQQALPLDISSKRDSSVYIKTNNPPPAPEPFIEQHSENGTENSNELVALRKRVTYLEGWRDAMMWLEEQKNRRPPKEE